MRTSRYIGELDLLRFMAALAVLFFHLAFRGAAADGLSPLSYTPLAEISKYGYLGVDLFFMISGFVIMLSAQSGSVKSFVISRMSRLYPAYWICCTVTFATILISGTTLFPASLREWGINLTMMPGSFSTAFLDGSYWSLAVELKFYFLIALVLAIGQIKNAEWFMYGWLAVAVVHSLVPIPWLASKLILVFAPCFISGALFYFILQKGATPLRWVGIGASWILVLKRGVDLRVEQVAHYGVPHSVVVICFVLTAFFVIFAAIALGKSGSLQKMKWPLLGALTYPLYLLHQTIGYILITAFHGSVNDHVLFWGTVLLSVSGAYIVAVYIEPPLMRLMRRVLVELVTKFQSSFGLNGAAR